MKRFGLIVLLAAMTGLLSFGAPIPCPTGQGTGLSLEYLILGDGCWLEDKLFDGFQQSANGSVSAANTTVSFVQSGGIYKVTIGPDFGAWQSDMQVTYNVTVLEPGWFIHVVSQQAFFAPSPTGDTVVFGVDPNNGPLMQQTAMNQGAGQQTVQFNSLSATSLTVYADFNPAPGTGFGAGQLFSIESAIGQAAIPEPATFALLGCGLAALALYRRRRRA